MLSKLNTLVGEVRENLDKYELGIAAQKIYDFIWDTYCDWYIELTKSRLNGADAAAKEGAERVLLYVLTGILKLLHPFMPFITEEIYQALPHESEALIIAPYPKYDEALRFPAEEASFELVMDAIRAIRSRRADMNVPPSRKAKVIVATAERRHLRRRARRTLQRLASASEVEVVDADYAAGPPAWSPSPPTAARLLMPMAELVDLEAERAQAQQGAGEGQQAA